MILDWETLNRRTIADCRIFTIDSVERRHPKQDKNGEFFVLNSPEWVNIIPLTPTGDVVMVRQYRHGSDSVTLEIPGGLVNKGEEPMLAAMRECTEETGFSSAISAELVGINAPNPAFLDNRCYSYYWENCTLSAVQSLDEHEDIQVVLVPLAEIPERIARGEINHSLVLTAFFFYFLRAKSL